MSADGARETAARTELARLLGKHYGTSAAGDDYHWAMADILIEKGWHKAEPDWSETLLNDGEYEYTVSSDCDGSNVKHWRREPRLVYKSDYFPWEQYGSEEDAHA